MPARDGTGPAGRGPMTGWGRGSCRGTGRGMRRGLSSKGVCGFCRQRLAPADEQKMLADEVQAVSEHLKGLQERQKELNGK